MADTATVSEQELDRLEVLLDDPALAEAMRLDEIQGYLCASLTGPQPKPVEDCLDAILGEGDDAEVRREAGDLIGRIAAHIEHQLSGEDGFALWLYPLTEAEDSEMDFGPWCMAYLHGVDDAIEDWFDDLNEEETSFLDERLYPLIVVTGEAEAAAKQHGEAWPEGDELAELMKECGEQAPGMVEDIHRFWRAKRGGPTQRRDAPKVGRNDPCTCGSGKKYKQCCGA